MTSDPVAALLQPERLTAVVDIGANPIDTDPPYKRMLARRLCSRRRRMGSAGCPLSAGMSG